MANLQWAYDTQANWLSNNRIPLLGEICEETDTGWFKRGDGSTAYASLPYMAAIKQRDLPTWAPVLLQHAWDARQASYNFTDNQYPFRADIKKVQGGTADCHLMLAGDSLFTGMNGTLWVFDKSIPRMFARALSHLLGDTPWQGGIQPAVAQQSWVFDNIVMTGSFTAQASQAASSGAAVGTYKWTSIDPVTNISFAVDNRSTSGFTYSVDGGSAQTVTTDGTTSMKPVNITGLTKGIHSVTVNATAAQTVVLYGWRGWDPSVKSLHLHTIAIGGARAAGGATNGKNFSDTTTTLGSQGLGWVYQNLISVFGITPDIQIITAGGNDINGGGTPAATVTGLTTIKGYNSSVPTLFVRSYKYPGANQTNWDDFSGRWMTMLDTLNSPGFDWDYWTGRDSGASAQGLLGADGVHPTFDEQAGVARHLAQILTQADYQGPADPVVATFSKSGTLTTGTGTFRWYNDSGRTLKINNIRAATGTAPTGAALIVDINLNGTTIYTTQANRPTVAVSTNTIKSTNPDVNVIPDGGYLTVDIDQIGSTVAGSDLTVTVNMV